MQGNSVRLAPLALFRRSTLYTKPFLSAHSHVELHVHGIPAYHTASKIMAKKPTSKASCTVAAGQSGGNKRVLHWFRTDLRINDAPALRAACGLDADGKDAGDIEAFYPVWTWDPQYVWKHRVGVNRWQFLLQSMQDLSDSLTKIDSKHKLIVLRGSPEDVLPIVWEQWGITDMFIEKDTAAYARQRDEAVFKLAAEHAPSLRIHVVMGHNLLDPEEVVKKGNDGKPIASLATWKKAAVKCGKIARPLPALDKLPPPGNLTISVEGKEGKKRVQGREKESESGSQMQGPFAKLKGINVNEAIMDEKKFNCYKTISGPEGKFSVPTMESLGLGEATTSIKGGEAEGRKRLEKFLSNPTKVATFSKPMTAPTSLEPSTTLLSPYIKFGCVSVRELYWRSNDIAAAYKPKKGEKVTKEPENMAGQLEFRDLYYAAEFATPNYDRIRGNHLSRFMNWSLQNVYDENGEMIIPRPRGPEKHEERYAAFREGRTGFPWIDAVMRQLRTEGWIHHLARHSVACFLTRGQCYISWERGTEVFDEYLLDWDPASNPGNWMWLSCSAFFAQYFRVYGLTSWPMKTDKTGKLVRKYCPELKNFPDKYIYEPWKAPLSVQKEAKCLIGSGSDCSYPAPMLDEHKEKERCIARLKVAYEMGFHGDSKEVLDGTAADLLKKAYRDKFGKDEDEDDDADEDADNVKQQNNGKRKTAAANGGDPTGPMDGFVRKSKRTKDK